MSWLIGLDACAALGIERAENPESEGLCLGKVVIRALTLLSTLSACREAASTLQVIATLPLPGRKAANRPAGEAEANTIDPPALSLHKRAQETTSAQGCIERCALWGEPNHSDGSMRPGWARSPGSASLRRSVASMQLALVLLLISRRRT